VLPLFRRDPIRSPSRNPSATVLLSRSSHAPGRPHAPHAPIHTISARSRRSGSGREPSDPILTRATLARRGERPAGSGRHVGAAGCRLVLSLRRAAYLLPEGGYACSGHRRVPQRPIRRPPACRARTFSDTFSASRRFALILGPTAPLYLAGSRMREVYPHLPLFERQGISVALLSYVGRLAICVTADSDLGGLQRDIVQRLEDGMAALGVAVGVAEANAGAGRVPPRTPATPPAPGSPRLALSQRSVRHPHRGAPVVVWPCARRTCYERAAGW
jgi:hypothetical protein